MNPTTYCQYHDLAFCERHKAECLGGERCDPQPTTAGSMVTFCSVCAGIVKPAEERK